MSELRGEEKEERPGALERLQRARKWFWQNWADDPRVVYRRSVQGRPSGRTGFIHFFLFLRELLRVYWNGEISSRAAALGYTTLLSLIPLIFAFSQVLGNLFATALPRFRDRLDQFLNIVLPYESSAVASHINRFVDNAGAASGIGGIAFLVISFRLFLAVEGTVNQIWRVETQRGYRQRLRNFTMILFWGPVLIGASFTLLGSMEKNPTVYGIVYHPVLAAVFPVLVLFVAFTMLFWMVPATRVHFKNAALGAAVAAILFELVRLGLGYYATALFAGRLNVIYGTLGLLILFLIALELMWLVILLGVAVSYVHQNLQGILRATEQQLEEKPGFDLYFAVRGLIEVARRFEQREDAPSSYRLAEEFGATDGQMLRVLKRLEDGQLVKQIGGEWTGYVPGCDPDRITVQEVIEQMEGGMREIPAPVGEEGDDPVREPLVALFGRLHACTSDSVGRITVGQLLREIHGPRRPSRGEDHPALDF